MLLPVVLVLFSNRECARMKMHCTHTHLAISQFVRCIRFRGDNEWYAFASNVHIIKSVYVRCIDDDGAVLATQKRNRSE